MIALRSEVTEAVHRLLNVQLNLPLDEMHGDGVNLFDDLGVDSLDAVELLIKADYSFNLDISDEDCDGVNTVGELVSMLMRHGVTGYQCRQVLAEEVTTFDY